MITYVKGDLLTTEAPVIVHGCNCQGVMGSGVALAIKTKWPEVFKAYREKYLKSGLKPGDFVAVFVEDNKLVVNALTQEFYGRDGKQYVSYAAIINCMKKINMLIKRTGLEIKQIAMPKIGSGLGGGSWSVISSIVAEELKDFEVLVYEL